MAKYRYVQTCFWKDSEIEDLTPEQRYFFLYILTNPCTTQCGIYEISLRMIENETGYNKDTIIKLIDIFTKKGKIIYNSDTKEMAIKNWPKHNCSRSPKVIGCINKELKEVKDRALVNWLYGSDTVSIGYAYSIDTLSIPYRKEKEKEKEKEIYIPDQAIACSGLLPSPQGDNELKKSSKERKNLEVDEKFKSFIEKVFNPIRMRAGKGLKPVGLNSKKAKKQFSELIKTYTGKDFVTVMQNAVTDKYHLENNFYYLTPEFITREDKFTRFLNMSQVKIPTSQIPAEYSRQRTREEVDNMFG